MMRISDENLFIYYFCVSVLLETVTERLGDCVRKVSLENYILLKDPLHTTHVSIILTVFV